MHFINQNNYFLCTWQIYDIPIRKSNTNVASILQLDIILEKSNCWVTHCTLTWLLQEGCDDFSDIGIVVFDVMPKVVFQVFDGFV